MNFTLLKKEQVIGDGALDVMKKKQGVIAAPTDLALVLGAYVSNFRNRVGGRPAEWTDDVACDYLTTTRADDRDPGCVYRTGRISGSVSPCSPNWRTGGVRPVLSPEEASKIIPSETAIDRIRARIKGIRVVEYGEYPQTIANKRTSNKLESLYKSGSLRPTGKDYTFDSVHPENKESPFKAISYPEYELDGKRYIRVLSNLSRYGKEERLSNGEEIREGEYYWLKVERVKWWLDPKGTMVAQKCLFGGIQFDTKKEYDGDFSKPFMKHYMDKYFAKEMMPLERTDVRKRIEANKRRTLAAKVAEKMFPKGRRTER